MEIKTTRENDEGHGCFSCQLYSTCHLRREVFDVVGGTCFLPGDDAGKWIPEIFAVIGEHCVLYQAAEAEAEKILVADLEAAGCRVGFAKTTGGDWEVFINGDDDAWAGGADLPKALARAVRRWEEAQAVAAKEEVEDAQ